MAVKILYKGFLIAETTMDTSHIRKAENAGFTIITSEDLRKNNTEGGEKEC